MMMVVRICFLSIICISAIHSTIAQVQSSLAFTYASPEFKEVPGLEYGLHYQKYKIYISGSYFFDNPNINQIANISEPTPRGFNHYGLGYGYRVHEGKVSFDLSVHLIRHLGPRYDELDYYQSGGYYIYRRSTKSTFGVPICAYIVYRKMFVMLNYDLGINRYRYGIGIFLNK